MFVQNSPFAFPLNPDKWSIILISDSNSLISSPSSSFTQFPGIQLTIGKGLWKLSASFIFHGVYNAITSQTVSAVTLSTSTTSITDRNMLAWFGGQYNTISSYFNNTYMSRIINLDTPTTFYMISNTTTGTASEVRLRGDVGRTIIQAVCAYL